MSRQAFDAVVSDYETFDTREAYADRICVHEVSKGITGRFKVERQGAAGCEDPSCRTLKQAGEFTAEIDAGPCDSEQSKALNGTLEGQFVAAYENGETTNRGGQTGKFRWQGVDTEVVGRMRGIVNAGTHYHPIGDCEKCHSVNHVEGWLRAAVVEGTHQGCREPRGPAHLPVQVNEQSRLRLRNRLAVVLLAGGARCL